MQNCESAENKNNLNFVSKAEPITPTTPLKKKKKRAATTTRKKTLEDLDVEKPRKTVIKTDIQTTAKKSRWKEPPSSQLRINSFFKSCSKSYKIETCTVKDDIISSKAQANKKSKTTEKCDARGLNSAQRNKGRKRLFKEDECTIMSRLSDMKPTGPDSTHGKEKFKDELDVIIDLISDDDVEEEDVKPNLKELKPQLCSNVAKKCPRFSESNGIRSPVMVSIPVRPKNIETTGEESNLISNLKHSCSKKRSIITETDGLSRENENVKHNKKRAQVKDETNLCQETGTAINKKHKMAVNDKENTTEEPLLAQIPTPPQTSIDRFSSDRVSNLDCSLAAKDEFVETRNISRIPVQDSRPAPTSKGGRVKKVRVCPPFKIVAGTTFAVDAFQYGQIEGVTHYFLTHFHADHYQGLTRKFAMPLYVSSLTARLLRALIPVEEQYVREINLNMPLVVNGIEVTAIDANHCPGAVMFVFKLSTGRCIIHTGDFRASPDMESEPIFWNNWIDTIYLDTTYIAHKNNFCSQYESIDRAKSIIEEFRQKRPTTRVLYICGSYVIGKERFWTRLAQEFGLKVWTEKNRLTALQAMDLEEVRGLLCDDPYMAQMHVISIGKVSYQSLVEYFRPFQTNFDAVLAFRPSGWEKNGKPSLRGQINIVGIEYSEHSSHAELERFVTYLKPREVISTVPIMQGNPCITPKIPEKWYKYDTLKSRKRNFQPSITSFIKIRPQKRSHSSTKLITNCVSPTKSSCSQNELSQLSVRVMTTCVLPEVKRDVSTDQQATPSKASATVITLLSD
ncbi:DNA cross-link repair 1 protein [Anastrepha obliqua]|uniref:DNA cross-link repair 1 protein n=1 Tax=Anastrepha obliqua TaxID=95512 RepID=UPI00240A2DF5|nr:DNA cross-link repair 1 protein [Anastrepha obliqua]